MMKKTKKQSKSNVLQYPQREIRCMTEEDFLSAELEIVPAGKARDMRSGQKHGYAAYGQDDRVCAYHFLCSQ